MIDMQAVCKIFRTDLVETKALRSFTLKVGAGEFVAITGHSGSGKTTLLNVATNLGDHSYTLPECNATFDLRRSSLRFGVVPCGIHIAFTVDVQRVMVGRALPRTHACVATRFQQRRIDRLARKIMVTFHDHRILRLCNHGTKTESNYVPCRCKRFTNKQLRGHTKCTTTIQRETDEGFPPKRRRSRVITCQSRRTTAAM